MLVESGPLHREHTHRSGRFTSLKYDAVVVLVRFVALLSVGLALATAAWRITQQLHDFGQ